MDTLRTDSSTQVHGAGSRIERRMRDASTKNPHLRNRDTWMRRLYDNRDTARSLIRTQRIKDIAFACTPLYCSIMGTLNNCFFPYTKSKKAVISLVFAHKGSFKNIVFQTALMVIELYCHE